MDRWHVWSFGILLALLSCGIGATASPEVQAGTAWLQAQVSASGEVANASASVATPLQTRAEIVQTFKTLSIVPAAGLVDAVAADTDGNSEYISRQILSLVQTGRNSAALVDALLALQNTDGGFGGRTGYRSDALDTAWALLALKAANYNSANVLSGALSFLAASANSDGGYALPDSPTASQVYVTALALRALQSFGQVYPSSAVTAAALHWLVTQQTSGSYGSTVLDSTAVATLVAATTDVTKYAGPLAAIRAAQRSDGSWDGDPYGTALALRALFLAENQSATPTNGTIGGRILEKGSQAPLPGALARLLEAPSITATAGADGGFALNGVAPGVYTVDISKSGYATVTLAQVTVTAGNTANVGNVLLGMETTTAIVRGTVTDGAAGTPLASASVALSGAASRSAVTDAKGSYEFTGLPAGQVTVDVTKSGYDPVGATATLRAGTVTMFSPSLYPQGTTPTTATLQGHVVDAANGQPISGATITAAGKTATTDNAGQFVLTDLAVGAFSATLNATGYNGATLSGTLVHGLNDAGIVRLAKSTAATTTASGTVRDSATGQALAGATIRAQGTAAIAITGADGHYQIAGISAAAFTLNAAAAGYQSQNSSVTADPGSSVLADFSLVKSTAASGVQIASVTTDKNAYAPYSTVEIHADVRNAANQAADLIFSATILDAQSRSIAEEPAIRLVLGQNPADAVQAVPANGNRTITIKWPNLSTTAGRYSAVVRAFDTEGNLVAEGGTAFDINEVQRLGGGITLTPPITQADSKQPIAIGANVLNYGNAPIPAGPVELTVTLAVPDNVPPAAPTTAVKLVLGGAPLNSPRGGTFDDAGNYYVVNFNDRRVVKIAASGEATVLATLPSTAANAAVQPVDITRDSAGLLWILNSSNLALKLAPDGALNQVATGLSQQFGIDADTDGNVYVIGSNDGTDRLVVKIDPAGQITTLVTNGLAGPTGIVSIGNGEWLVSNYGGNSIAKIDSAGHVSPFAKGLNRPQGLTLDGQGNVYVANSGANNVVKIALDGTQSVYAEGLSNPSDLRFDTAGNLFVSNPGNNTVARIRADGRLETFARGIAVNPEGMRYDGAGNLYIANGNGTITRLDSAGQYSVVAAGLNAPKDIEISAGGDLLVANYGSGTITKHAGGGTSTFASGLQSPYGLALDGQGLLYVSETSANRISTVDGNGQRTTALISLLNSPQDVLEGSGGDVYVLNSGYLSRIGANGTGNIIAAGFGDARALTRGPDGSFYVLDGYYTVKRVAPDGSVSTVKTNMPYNDGGIAVDAAGNLYLADYSNRRLLRVDSSGTVSTFASVGFYPSRLINDGQGGFYALSVYGELFAIDANGASTYLARVSSGRTLAKGSDGRLFVGTSSDVVAVTPTTGTQSTVIKGLNNITAAIPLADGTLAVSERSLHLLTIFDSTSARVDQISGFTAPRDLVWTGSDFIFADGNAALLSWKPGAHPHRVGSGPMANYLALQNGVLYASNANGVATLAANGSLPYYYTVAGLTNVSGLAFRPDGALTLAGNTDSRILTLNAAKQTVAAYAGLSNPTGLAIDSSGNVFVANGGTQQVVRIDAAGQRSDVFASNTPTAGLAFDGAGTLYGVQGDTVYRFDGAGNRTAVASKSGATLARLAFDGLSLVATSTGNSLAYRSQGTALVPFAAGLAGAQGVRVGPDKAVYIASATNGTVTRYAGNTLSIHASGLPNPRRLAFGKSGALYVAGNSGSVTVVAATESTDLKVQTLIGSNAFDGIAADGLGRVMLTRAAQNDVYSFDEPQAQSLPPAGTVVHTVVADVADLAVGSETLPLSLGSWTPHFSGDYEIRLRSQQAGVTGALVNYLHVGPHADAAMVTDRTLVTPTQDRVGVSIAVQGADFTRLSKVDTANLVRSVSSGAYPSAMGADAAGNIYFVSGGVVKQVNKAGTITTFANKNTTIRGQIPVDSGQNLYIGDGAYSSRLLRLAPDGTASLLATLPSSIVSLAINDKDELFALTGSQIIKIRPDGTQSLVTSAGISSPFSLTVDGRGNLYVQNSGNVINRVAPDGGVSTLLTEAQFEYEGNNIAGDCADNLFITPFYWSKVGQYGEEYTIAQLIGRTGQAASILDGRTVNSDLTDMDFIVYDRFSSNLLIWTDYNGGRIYKLPVTCGAISAELHMVLPPGQSANAPNPAPTAALAQTDGSTEYVWNLKDVTALGQTVRFDTTLSSLALGQERAVVRDAYLVFRNSFVAGDVRLPLAVPKVRVANRVQMTIATDQPAYPQNAGAVVRVDLANTDSAPVDGTLAVDILDAQGVRVARLLSEPTTIGANGGLNRSPAFNTGNTLVGPYTAQASLLDGAGSELAVAASQFRIVGGDGSGALLSATVATDKSTYQAYETVHIQGRMRNITANQILDQLTVGETVKDVSGQPVYVASQTIPQLIPGLLSDLVFPWPVASAPPGRYTVEQRVTDAGGAVLDVATTSFTVASTADTGAGLKGTLTATPRAVERDGVVSLAASVQNTGNADVMQLPIKLAVVDPAKNQVLAEWTDTADLAKGASRPLTRTWTAQIAEGTYVAVLSVTVGGAERVLAQNDFKVVAPAVKLKLTAQVRDAARLLVLVSCPEADEEEENDDDQGGHYDSRRQGAGRTADDRHGGRCAKVRAQWLESFLSTRKIPHHIVTTPKDFTAELRCGRYDVYWLSGGAAKFETLLLGELREAVRRGESLLRDGVHDERNDTLEALAGVTYRGHLPRQDYAVALAEPLFLTTTLTSKGGALKYALQGGTVHASFPGASGLPAVIGHRLGEGRSLLFALDLVGNLRQDSAWGAAFDAALDELQPALPERYPGAARLPLALDLENAGPAVTVLATARWPAGFALDGVPAGAVLDSMGWPQWTFDLTRSARKTLALDLRAPFASGTYAIAFDVDTLVGGVRRPYGTAVLDVTVEAAPQAGPPLLARIRGLEPKPMAERRARDRAARAVDCGLAWLAGSGRTDCASHRDSGTQASQNVAAPQDHGRDDDCNAHSPTHQALQQFLNAQDELARILSVPVDSLQNGVAMLVAEAEHRLCQSGEDGCQDHDKSVAPASAKPKAQ